jgi:hypothetical protein
MSQLVIEKEKTRLDAPLQKPRRRRIHQFIEFLFFLCVGLLALEVYLTFAGIADDQYQDVDYLMGFTPMPNRTYTFRNEGFSRSTINSLGMRDVERTIFKPPNTFRIAVIGCSLTQGNQVPMAETYCSALERSLNEKDRSRKYEVLNFAVAAHNVSQEYLRLKHFALQFKPDLVIFTLRTGAISFMQPALGRGLNGVSPFFYIAPDGKLAIDRTLQDKWLASPEGQRICHSGWLRYHSRIWAVASKCFGNITDFAENTKRSLLQNHRIEKLSKRLANAFAVLGTKKGEAKVQENSRAIAWQSPAEVALAQNKDEAFDSLGRTAWRLIQESKGECDKAGSRFIVVYLPTPSIPREQREQELFEYCAKLNGLTFWDCNPHFDRLEKIHGKKLYYPTHYATAGHKELASELERFLASNNFLQ